VSRMCKIIRKTFLHKNLYNQGFQNHTLKLYNIKMDGAGT